ncbi:hypothetical protein [Psychrobacter sp. DM8]|uniref:hypothetical protein n=1 Tax=unclassified Psychrobacter TaxID=196806 RepID=UPI003F4FD9F2
MNESTAIRKFDSDASATSYLNIKSYNFYIARQGYSDEELRFSEISCILTLNIPEITVHDMTINTIEIYFRTAGSIRKQYKYTKSSKTLNLELSHDDLSAWSSGMMHPKAYLDLISFDSKHIKLYLFAGN